MLIALISCWACCCCRKRQRLRESAPARGTLVVPPLILTQEVLQASSFDKEMDCRDGRERRGSRDARGGRRRQAYPDYPAYPYPVSLPPGPEYDPRDRHYDSHIDAHYDQDYDPDYDPDYDINDRDPRYTRNTGADSSPDGPSRTYSETSGEDLRYSSATYLQYPF